MSFNIQTLVQAGVTDETPENVINRLILTNQIAIALFGFSLFYTLFFILYIPGLTFVAIILGISVLLYFGLNLALQAINISRFIISVITPVVVLLAHSYQVQPGDPLLPAFSLIQLTTCILPWITFDMSERKSFLPATILVSAIFIFHPVFSDYFTMDYDQSIVQNSAFKIITSGTSVVFLVLSFVLLQRLNIMTVTKNAATIDLMNKKKKELDEQHKNLENTLKEMEIARQKDQNENLIVSGMSRINNIARSMSGLELYKGLISEIVDFLNLQQAALYLIENKGNEDYLELKASYALDREWRNLKKIPKDDGFLWQCINERKKIVLKKVQGHISKISSGLGIAHPANIVYTPLLNKNIVEGIIYTAAFKKLQDYEIEYLDRVGESIAEQINNAKLNTKSKELLEETQMQEEQLRAQEEEMRQNMEEMQATQESMIRKEKEYVDQIERLKKQISTLKASNQGTIL